MKAVLEKYHCMGNDYLVFDPNKNEMKLGEEQVKMLCDRILASVQTEFWRGRYWTESRCM